MSFAIFPFARMRPARWLAPLLVCACLTSAGWSQDELGDLRRTQSPADATGPSGDGAGLRVNPPPGPTSLSAMGLPADAPQQAARRLPPADRRVAPLPSPYSSPAPVERGADSFTLMASDESTRFAPLSPNPWDEALQAAGILSALASQSGGGNGTAARMQAVAADLRSTLEAGAQGDLSKPHPGLAKALTQVETDLTAFQSSAWSDKSWASFSRYSGMYSRWQATRALDASLERLSIEIRSARGAAPATGEAPRKLARALTMRLPGLVSGANGVAPEVRVTSPSGKSQTVPAYSDGGAWFVRVLGTETGRWTASGAGGVSASVEVPEKATSAIHVDPLFPRTFTRVDGKPFVPVGENLAWVLEGNTVDERLAAWRRYLDRLAANGCNWVRVWCCPWSMALETKDTGLGHYDENAARALDRLFESAADRGIYIQLVIEYHGMLRKDADWGKNPYNADCGGPCRSPGEFFASAEARRFFKKRLDFLVARYGACENLFSWELWNEVDLTEGLNIVNVARWHREMASYLKARDPWHHMVTTSMASRTPINAVIWTIPEIDYAQIHIYVKDLIDRLSEALAILRGYGKPALAGEAGHDSSGPEWEQKYDPTGIGIHDAQLAALFAGGAGTAMFWWWDNWIDPNRLYGVYRPISRIAGLFDTAAGMTPATLLVTGKGRLSLRSEALSSPGRALVWLKDDEYTPSPEHPRPAAVSRGPFTVRVDVEGGGNAWTVTRYDVQTGESSAAGTATRKLNAATFAVESFERDAVFLLSEK